MSFPEIFCWSKVGPEAGFTLEQIIRWKELQRSLSDGIFFWGIGGVPSREKQEAFIRAVARPKILFSEQIGEARPLFKNPNAVFLWTHYEKQAGREIALPPFSAVMSKAGGPKHYAIVCQANAPISVDITLGFDIGTYGNFLGRPNIAFQQTCPIVQLNKAGHPKCRYDRGFWADLVTPYFVTLSRGRELSRQEFSGIVALINSGTTNIDQFKQFVAKLKSSQ